MLSRTSATYSMQPSNKPGKIFIHSSNYIPGQVIFVSRGRVNENSNLRIKSQTKTRASIKIFSPKVSPSRSGNCNSNTNDSSIQLQSIGNNNLNSNLFKQKSIEQIISSMSQSVNRQISHEMQSIHQSKNLQNHVPDPKV